MDTLTRTYMGVLRTFEIYTQQEADERGIVYRPWRECVVGGYGLSDDGFVAECLACHEYRGMKGRTGRLLTFPYGRIWESSKAGLRYEERCATGDMNSTSATTWQEREARRTRTKNAVKAYVQYVISGKKPDWALIGVIYRPDQKIPAATVRRLFKQEVIEQMIAEELRQVLAGNGVDRVFVVEVMKGAIALAAKRGDAGNMLKGAMAFAEMLDMKPDTGQNFPTSPYGQMNCLPISMEELEEMDRKMEEAAKRSIGEITTNDHCPP